MRRLLPLLVLAACGGSPAVQGTTVTLEIPTGTVGFTILVSGEGIGASDFIGVETLKDPSGKAVVSDYLGVAQPDRRLSGRNGEALVAIRYPFADDHAADAVPAGKWTATLGAITGGKGSTMPVARTLTASVKAQTSAASGTLDLDVWIPKDLALNGATLEDRLSLAFGLFDRLFGLKRGEVRTHEIDGKFKSISGQDSVDAANRLVTATAGAQVVLTNVLSPEGTGEISGLSCVPGAVNTAGTVCSAVIVSLRANSAPWMDAATLVHELGHFAGLSHSTEFDGNTDALADTPACTDLSKANLNSCPDHDNLMFPSVNSATDLASISVSANQRAVVRGSSIYR